MADDPTHLGTPETEQIATPAEMRVIRIDFDHNQDPMWLHFSMTPTTARWIDARCKAVIPHQPEGAVALLDMKTARALHADAGQQVPVTHESHEVYSCLGNIINRFDDRGDPMTTDIRPLVDVIEQACVDPGSIVPRDGAEPTCRQAVRAVLHVIATGQIGSLIRDLTDLDDCDYDHHGGCQAHGYLSLEPGEQCPHAEAKSLTELFDKITEGVQ